jgi:hypothetical protein
VSSSVELFSSTGISEVVFRLPFPFPFLSFLSFFSFFSFLGRFFREEAFALRFPPRRTEEGRGEGVERGEDGEGERRDRARGGCGAGSSRGEGDRGEERGEMDIGEIFPPPEEDSRGEDCLLITVAMARLKFCCAGCL